MAIAGIPERPIIALMFNSPPCRWRPSVRVATPSPQANRQPAGYYGRWRLAFARLHGGPPMAGYSGTPLPRKLGIKPAHRVALINAPAGFEQTLASLPD